MGWIKLDRKIMDSDIWKNEHFNMATAWIDMLLLAGHKETKIIIDHNVIHLQRGSFHTSINKLAERWKWNRKTVMKFLDLLEKDEMITQTRTTKGTTIHIVNYCKYQDRADYGVDCGMDYGMDCGVDTIKNNKNKKNKRIYTHPNSFCQIEQQDYDIEQIEKELLSN